MEGKRGKKLALAFSMNVTRESDQVHVHAMDNFFTPVVAGDG